MSDQKREQESKSGNLVVYLAGPIDELEKGEGDFWYADVAESLRQYLSQDNDGKHTDPVFYGPADAFRHSFGSSLTNHEGKAYVRAVNRVALGLADLVVVKLYPRDKCFGTIREVEAARQEGKPVLYLSPLPLENVEALDLIWLGGTEPDWSRAFPERDWSREAD